VTNTVNALNVTGSCINANSYIAVNNSTASSQNFTGNWWGYGDGPSGVGPGLGDEVSANIDYSGFLTSESGTCYDNLLLNGSFETDTTPADLRPDDWTGKGLILSASVDGQDCTTAAEGSCSMRFKGDGNGSKLEQVINVSGNGGDIFVLTFNSLNSGVSGSGAYRVKASLFYTDGSKQTFKINGNISVSGWGVYYLEIPAEHAYTKLVLTIQFTKSAGTAWFDNFLLIRE
jgi:hypothetical protein